MEYYRYSIHSKTHDTEFTNSKKLEILSYQIQKHSDYCLNFVWIGAGTQVIEL